MKEIKVPCPKCRTAVTAQKGDWTMQWQCKICGLQSYIAVSSKRKPLTVRAGTAIPQKTITKILGRQKRTGANKKKIVGFSITFLLVASEFSLLVVNVLIPNPIALFLCVAMISILILWVFDLGRNMNK
jgi:Flp pilus assembly protein TadB